MNSHAVSSISGLNAVLGTLGGGEKPVTKPAARKFKPKGALAKAAAAKASKASKAEAAKKAKAAKKASKESFLYTLIVTFVFTIFNGLKTFAFSVSFCFSFVCLLRLQSLMGLKRFAFSVSSCFSFVCLYVSSFFNIYIYIYIKEKADAVAAKKSEAAKGAKAAKSEAAKAAKGAKAAKAKAGATKETKAAKAGAAKAEAAKAPKAAKAAKAAKAPKAPKAAKAPEAQKADNWEEIFDSPPKKKVKIEVVSPEKAAAGVEAANKKGKESLVNAIRHVYVCNLECVCKCSSLVFPFRVFSLFVCMHLVVMIFVSHITRPAVTSLHQRRELAMEMARVLARTPLHTHFC